MTTDRSPHTPGVTFDASAPALVITDLVADHLAVTQEALRWSGGRRGPSVAAAELAGTDLTAFALQALTVGASAITAAGGAQDTFNLEQLVQDVGSRTTEATERVAASTVKVTSEASKAMDKATRDVRTSLVESSDAAKKAMGETVAAARKELRDELTRLFGGDDPELVARLQPVLADFTVQLTKRTDEHTAAIFDKATRALDPDDPASPFAKQMRAFDTRHAELAAQSAKQHEALTTKVAELTTAFEVQKAAAAATRAAADVTPIKGATYELNAGVVVAELARGFGDEYLATGSTVGRITGCLKGDGVLTVGNSQAKVVIEAHNSDGGAKRKARRAWGDYLDEAERNRGAAASLGLVPTSEQNGGHQIRVLGGRRIVLAFDPESDDPALLHTVLCLLRAAAVASHRHDDGGEVSDARERIAEALEALTRLDGIRSVAGQISTNGKKLRDEAEALHIALNRLLLQAQTALAGSPLTAVADSPETTGVA